MNKILYKDNKYELAYNNKGMYIVVNESRYELSSHPYEPCTYIETMDGILKIVIHNAFDLSFVIKDLEEDGKINGGKFGIISALEFCEIINAYILKNKSIIKQQIAKETNCKTSNNFNIKNIE